MCNRSSFYVIVCILTCSRGVWSTDLKHTSQFSNQNNSKIIRGSDAVIENYPYNVFFKLYDGIKITYCGGSIVSRTSIVTSAGCLQGVKEIKVRIGSTFSEKEACPSCPAFEYVTSSYSIHPRYNNRTQDFDVGVVHIKGGMNLNGERTSFIRLPTTSDDASMGEVITITGWGATEEDGTERNIVLQMGKASVITRGDCRAQIRGVSRRMFCAKGEANICKGDFGSPARGPQNVLTGIASFSPKCNEEDVPGVYTRVGEFLIRSYLRSQTGM